jgi:hypothetical protein
VTEMMIRDAPLLGGPVDIDPHEAVLQEVQRTAGHVQWLQLVIAALGEDPSSENAEELESLTGMFAEGYQKTLFQRTDKGMDMSVWMQIYQSERTHLIRACKMAVDMGCEERRVRIVEDQGRKIAEIFQKITLSEELALTNAQKVVLPKILRRELTSIDTTATEVKK